MRKLLISCCYILVGSAYGLAIFSMCHVVKNLTFNSTFESMTNYLFGFLAGLIIILFPAALIKKENRCDLKNEIESIVDFLIENTILPLKKNVKRKEFWILQSYMLTRILTFINKFLFMVYVFPVALFMLDSSKEVGVFATNFVTLMIFVNVARIFISLFESNWRRCIKQALHVTILISTTRTLEKAYQTLKISSIGEPAGNHELTIILIVLGYILALRFIKNRILDSIEKDLSIDRNQMFDKAKFGIPCYSFEKYKDLIKIESIDFHYQGFNEYGPHSWITFVGYLRYGLLQFEMTKQPKMFTAKIAKVMPRKELSKQVDQTIDVKQSMDKEAENDS